jgi:hypothetical protein
MYFLCSAWPWDQKGEGSVCQRHLILFRWPRPGQRMMNHTHTCSLRSMYKNLSQVFSGVRKGWLLPNRKAATRFAVPTEPVEAV